MKVQNDLSPGTTKETGSTVTQGGQDPSLHDQATGTETETTGWDETVFGPLITKIYQPGQIAAYILKQWTRIEIEQFALDLLGDEYRQLRSAAIDLRCKLHDTEILANKERIRAGISEHALELAGALNRQLTESNQQLQNRISVLASAIQSSETDREKLEDELKHLHGKVDPRIEEFAEYAMAIKPDKRCTRPGCYGTRGYHGITLDIAPGDSHKAQKITFNLCCGKVGQSDYVLLRNHFGRRLDDIRTLLGEMNLGLTAIGNHTLPWSVKFRSAMAKLHGVMFRKAKGESE